MVKYILITTLLLFAFTKGRAQTNIYHAFPDSNGVWSEVFNQMPCNCPVPPPPAWSPLCTVPCGYYKKKFISGDTTIGTYLYHKVYTSTSVFQYNGTFAAGTEFSFGLRQDVVNKKIYAFVPFIGDTLLYDLNLQVGDTLSESYLSDAGANYVSSIDSVLIDNQYRNAYHIGMIGYPQFYDYTFLIEGIGSSFGIAEKLIAPFETTNILNCFSLKDSTVYVNPFSTADCNMELGKNNPHVPETLLAIYPNPFTTSSTITTHVKDATIDIYDVFGQLINQIKNSNKPEITFHRDNLHSGLYFIHLTKDNKIVARDKFIIIED